MIVNRSLSSGSNCELVSTSSSCMMNRENEDLGKKPFVKIVFHPPIISRIASFCRQREYVCLQLSNKGVFQALHTPYSIHHLALAILHRRVDESQWSHFSVSLRLSLPVLEAAISSFQDVQVVSKDIEELKQEDTFAHKLYAERLNGYKFSECERVDAEGEKHLSNLIGELISLKENPLRLQNVRPIVEFIRSLKVPKASVASKSHLIPYLLSHAVKDLTTASKYAVLSAILEISCCKELALNIALTDSSFIYSLPSAFTASPDLMLQLVRRNHTYIGLLGSALRNDPEFMKELIKHVGERAFCYLGESLQSNPAFKEELEKLGLNHSYVSRFDGS